MVNQKKQKQIRHKKKTIYNTTKNSTEPNIIRKITTESKARRGNARQDEVRRDKKKQDEIRRDETRQDEARGKREEGGGGSRQKGGRRGESSNVSGLAQKYQKVHRCQTHI